MTVRNQYISFPFDVPSVINLKVKAIKSQHPHCSISRLRHRVNCPSSAEASRSHKDLPNVITPTYEFVGKQLIMEREGKVSLFCLCLLILAGVWGWGMQWAEAEFVYYCLIDPSYTCDSYTCDSYTVWVYLSSAFSYYTTILLVYITCNESVPSLSKTPHIKTERNNFFYSSLHRGYDWTNNCTWSILH